jgi:hypothetical protein
MKHVLKPLKKLTGEPITISSDPTGELIAIDPDRNVKYVMVLDVGDMDNPQIRNHVKSASEMMTELLGHDRVLFAPRATGQEGIKIYEMHPVTDWCDECKSQKCECDFRRAKRGL